MLKELDRIETLIKKQSRQDLIEADKAMTM